MKRRVSALALTLVLALGLVVPCRAAKGAYFDVPAGAWYEQAAASVTAWGWINGLPDGGFHPDDTTSRAMLVTILFRRAGSPGVEKGAPFLDVPTVGWYYTPVAWAVSQGVVKGYSDDSFGPEDPVTREQLAVILWRLSGSPWYPQEEEFSDQGLISDFALEAVAWASRKGLMTGRGDGAFDPKAPATRAETAALLYRLSLPAENRA